MRIKMLEHYRDRNCYLIIGKEYDSEKIGQPLCDWLIEHRKADDVTPDCLATEPAQPDITPHALRLATEHGIDPTTISGSGTDGRILVSDVRNHLDSAETDNGAATDPREEP